MARNSAIEWCDHTCNFWTGCEHVSPACAGCYAESWAARAGRVFSERRRTSASTRSEPLKYQRDAPRFYREHLRRQLVFVNSLSDWADNKVQQSWRDDIFLMAKRCPHVMFLLLTKRIGNAIKMLPADWGNGYPNVWLGITVVTQAEAARDIPKLLRTPAQLRFLSIEPMIEIMFLRSLAITERIRLDCLAGQITASGIPKEPREAYAAGDRDMHVIDGIIGRKIDWVIAGGESGGQARPSNVRWYRELRQDCQDTGVPFFFKQWGEWAPPDQVPVVGDSKPLRARHEYIEDCYVMRFGKKLAGGQLDGKEHKAWPREVQVPLYAPLYPE